MQYVLKLQKIKWMMISRRLNIFSQIRSEDPGFQFSIELDDEKKIRTLMWINGKSREQFQYFGDVISFDTTYCTNIYKMPFGLFVGVNNHFQTTIFGGVFMKEETTRSFECFFSEFLSLMGGKLPQTVFTGERSNAILFVTSPYQCSLSNG